MNRMLPSTAPTCRSDIKDKDRQPLLFFGWSRLKVTIGDIHNCKFTVNSQSYSWILQVLAWPFCLSNVPVHILGLSPAPWVSYSAAGPALCLLTNMHTVTHSSQKQPTITGLPEIPAQTSACLIPLQDPEHPTCPFPAWGFWVNYTHTLTHTRFGECSYTLTPTSIQHMGCDPW